MTNFFQGSTLKDPKVEPWEKNYMTNNENKEKLIPAHGGYRNLKSYQSSEIVFDLTRIFCEKWIDKRDRTYDQACPVRDNFLRSML
jgi:hypothetical protein